MSSPYGYDAAPQQPYSNGVPSQSPVQVPPADGYSQQPAGYSQPQYSGYPQLPQPSYPTQPGYYPTQSSYNNSEDYNTKAVLGLIFAFLFWPAGLALAIMGRNEIDKNGGKGRGLTTAAFVICGIGAVYSLVVILLIIFGLASAGANSYAV